MIMDGITLNKEKNSDQNKTKKCKLGRKKEKKKKNWTTNLKIKFTLSFKTIRLFWETKKVDCVV